MQYDKNTCPIKREKQEHGGKCGWFDICNECIENPGNYTPCPFCGGQPIFQYAGDKHFAWNFECDTCQIVHEYFPTKFDAIKFWETRQKST